MGTVTSLYGANGRASEQDGSGATLLISLEREGQVLWTRSFPLSSEVTIGRDPGSVLFLDDDLVSRTHLLVRGAELGLDIEDVSTNGSLLDGTPLRRSTRRSELGRATVQLGQSTLLLRRAEAAAAESPAAPTPEAAPSREVEVAPTRSQRENQLRDAHELRRSIHRQLLEQLDLSSIDPLRREDAALRPRVLSALRRIVEQLLPNLPEGLKRDALVGEMADEALGLGPLEELLADPSVSEIMVVDPHTIYVERNGKLTLSGRKFTDDERVRAVIERIVTPLGRRVDESSPLVDARLADGSRVNIVIRPLALRGSCVTIRKFARTPVDLDKLLSYDALSEPMARFLTRSVRAKKNIVIAGGTGSGKTTLLNVLSGAIPSSERIVTIEDAAELQLSQPHVVSLESRPANMEGKGEISIRELVKNALRMRPDRIVVGECRGGEALDMLQAMNTGHDGSLTTTHANSPIEALSRLETLCMMAGLPLPQEAIRRQIAKSVHLLVQQSRLSDGSRRVTSITELVGLARDGSVQLRPIFEFAQTGMGADGKVLGGYRPTGYLPSFLHDMIVQGIIQPGEPYL